MRCSKECDLSTEDSDSNTLRRNVVMVCNAQYRAVMLACNGNVQEKEVQEEKYIALEYKMENYWQLSVLMI